MTAQFLDNGRSMAEAKPNLSIGNKLHRLQAMLELIAVARFLLLAGCRHAGRLPILRRLQSSAEEGQPSKLVVRGCFAPRLSVGVRHVLPDKDLLSGASLEYLGVDSAMPFERRLGAPRKIHCDNRLLRLPPCCRECRKLAAYDPPCLVTHPDTLSESVILDAFLIQPDSALV
jgi:hypothetical protein